MKIIFKESLISFVLSVLLIFVLSIIISKTSVAETAIIPGIIAISSISLCLGGIRVSKIKKEKGIINGFLLGMVYMLGMYIISSILLKDFSLNVKSFIMISCGMLAGMLGGIIGVNM